MMMVVVAMIMVMTRMIKSIVIRIMMIIMTVS